MMTVANAVALARRRRSIEPIRVIILQQAASDDDPWDVPFPMSFA